MCDVTSGWLLMCQEIKINSMAVLRSGEHKTHMAVLRFEHCVIPIHRIVSWHTCSLLSLHDGLCLSKCRHNSRKVLIAEAFCLELEDRKQSESG